jgi:putative nucleotidyltransferase with HDIG domain
MLTLHHASTIESESRAAAGGLTGSDLARHLAGNLLSGELPRRWQHVQGVAERAASFSTVHDQRTTDLLVAAGYLHDIGYASPISDTGFHPIDGARCLRRLGFDERLVTLIAHHSCAAVEAELWGLHDQLIEEFPFDPSLPNDELLLCDLTTDPGGTPIPLADRLDDVRRRYGPETTVRRFIDRAERQLTEAATRAALLLHRAAEADPSARPLPTAVTDLVHRHHHHADQLPDRGRPRAPELLPAR